MHEISSSTYIYHICIPLISSDCNLMMADIDETILLFCNYIYPAWNCHKFLFKNKALNYTLWSRKFPCNESLNCLGVIPEVKHTKHAKHSLTITSACVAVNPLNPKLNPICYLLALLGAHHFLHVSRIRVKLLTFRQLMSHIYGAPILDVSRSHTTTQHSQ